MEFKYVAIIIVGVVGFGALTQMFDSYQNTQQNIAIIQNPDRHFVVKNGKVYRQDIAYPNRFCRPVTENGSDTIDCIDVKD